jgi:hypothetical protein
MTQAGVNRVTSVAPLIFSAVAFAIVMANIIARVPPQPDENASAHIWQLLMVGQLPIIVAFLATSDWRNRSTKLIFAAQLMAFAAAAVPVWLAGY